MCGRSLNDVAPFVFLMVEGNGVAFIDRLIDWHCFPFYLFSHRYATSHRTYYCHSRKSTLIATRENTDEQTDGSFDSYVQLDRSSGFIDHVALGERRDAVSKLVSLFVWSRVERVWRRGRNGLTPLRGGIRATSWGTYRFSRRFLHGCRWCKP